MSQISEIVLILFLRTATTVKEHGHLTEKMWLT